MDKDELVVDLAIDGRHFIDFCAATKYQQDLVARIGAVTLTLKPEYQDGVRLMCNLLGETITNAGLYDDEKIEHLLNWILKKIASEERIRNDVR